MAHLSNLIIASVGGKGTYQTDDFLGKPKKASRKMSAKELRAMAYLAFGPPPKKN